ncbi:MAG: hypothetical protein JO197_17825 [Acidobacteria bacterium]|nr:hypothetical protein [Acidobacteriota bacterium]MBV9478964.1 hypothetical protein [Acidobacteriota bacterium]
MPATTIGRVRVRANAEDALAVRMRGEAALRALDLEPHGMPPQAILCIRALADPMPGAIDVRSSHASRATSWERAARIAIGDALRRAVRPALGFVPAAADAVLFADRAELLACAARDACRGALDAWWWMHLVRGMSFEAVIREWLRAPDYVAAAYALLAERGEALAFVRQLAAEDAIALATRVLDAHGHDALARIVSEAHAQPSPPRMATLARVLASPNVPPPAALTTEQQLFVAVIERVRSPHALPSARALEPILDAIAVPPRAHESRVQAAASPEVGSHDAATPRAFDDAPAAHRVDAPRAQESHREDVRDAPLASQPPVRALDDSRSEPSIDARELATPQDLAPTTSVREHEHASTLDTHDVASVTEVARLDDPAPHPLLSSTTALPPDANDAVEATIDTAADDDEPLAPPALPTLLAHAIDSPHAGVFFLLNIALALELYDPYAADAPELNLWDFLACTARALVPAIEDDDVWPLLARLAGREPHDELPPLDDELLARVRETLALFLDVDDPAAFLIRRYGRITLTPAHLDVAFALAAHPIEIRMAGLDRNPGWIPAAGLHVAFHFD